jgi:hypothetical protein
MPQRVMYDSDVIADLPRDEMCATYSDLVPDQATLTKLRTEFPFGLLLIDRHGDPTGAATILDVETGLHGTADIPGWLDRKKREGITGTIYLNRANLAAGLTAIGTLQHFLWVATLDGTMHIQGFKPGKSPAVIQCFSESMLGFHADGSVILHSGWHAKTAKWIGAESLLPDLESVIHSIRHHT